MAVKPLDDGLKQRLVGALVLLALAVIFLPVLFDRDPMAPVERTSQIPPAPEVVTVTINPPEEPEVMELAPEPATMYVPEEVEEVAAVPEPPGFAADGTPHAWVLQVASFREKNLADNLRAKLAEQGYEAYVRVVSYKNGTVHRVYVGPKLEKDALLLQKDTIERNLGLKALVLPFTPE
jgi:DedD protein